MRSSRRRPARASAILASLLGAAALVLTACGGDSPGADAEDDGRTSVVAAFYPLAYATEQVGGDAVSVTSLTPPGAEPHDIELSAAQVADIASADIVLYIRGFQPAVDEAVDQQAGDRAIDVSDGLALLAAEDGDGHADGDGDGDGDGHETGASTDPHVWLDPSNMTVIGDAIAGRVIEVQPATEPTVSADAAAFSAEMQGLDSEFRAGLQGCRTNQLVVSHEAFAYLAAAYGFTQVGISGLSPEAEPSPARMREVADLVREQGITTIYYETLVDPKVAQTLADETGASTAVLDPLEGLAEGSTGDYASVMRENLATLRAGQGCP